ncbi:fibrinogen-like protein 1-like protein [Bombina bombina]|uniref:fibrinogen-like protein 1-like protein n=1 Tax=Bombina bombina TaxID=8345 RepID=UPI00235A6074|nr:fibrinogen-like protein 1-like protein [Bombina bombina]
MLPWYLILLGIPFSLTDNNVEGLNYNQFLDIVNIDMVKDVNSILNLKDERQRKIFYTRDCDELYQLGHRENGLYVIRPEGSPKLVVQCYMYDCSGWTVIHRNSYDTEITWSNAWSIYKYGFGNIESDHWLGNHYIQLLTSQKWNKVRILLVDSENRTRHADYDSFFLNSENDKYRLRLGTYEGDAGDSLTSGSLRNIHDNMRFSTHDDDNDRSHNIKCADEYGGGWWYDSCYDAQLNRKTGIHWQTLCDHNCKSSLILIKPVHMYCNRV